MKIKELRTLPKEELEKKLVELRMGIMKDNTQIALGTLPKNPGKVRVLRKTVARILTLLGQKEKQSVGGVR